MLTREEIEEFQMLVLKIYGIELTLTEAENQGSRLIQAIELIMENRKKIIAKQFQKADNKEDNG